MIVETSSRFQDGFIFIAAILKENPLSHKYVIENGMSTFNASSARIFVLNRYPKFTYIFITFKILV